MNVLEHHMTGDTSPEHLMRCLARQVNSWPYKWRVAFLSKWQKSKGEASHGELRRLVNQQPMRDKQAGREALAKLRDAA